MLAIILALKEWRGDLKAARDEFEVVSNYKNLNYFVVVQDLSEQ